MILYKETRKIFSGKEKNWLESKEIIPQLITQN